VDKNKDFEGTDFETLNSIFMIEYLHISRYPHTTLMITFSSKHLSLFNKKTDLKKLTSNAIFNVYIVKLK
jgi:hypothetical protein